MTRMATMFRSPVSRFNFKSGLTLDKIKSINKRFLNMGGSAVEETTDSVFYSKIDVPLGQTRDKVSIAVISMNDKTSRNALGKETVHKMLKTLECLQADQADCNPVRAVIFRSNVPGVFCAGANLKERQAMNNKQVVAWLRVQRSLMDAISGFPYPTIAAIDGHALGGGLELALACDIRVINEKAKVGLVETKLAIIPGAGGTQRLARLVGLGRAKEHIFVAEPIDGTEAARIGVANHTATGDSGSYDKAVELAEKICRRGPTALRLAKAAIDDGSQTSLEIGLNIEQSYYCQLLDSRDRSEGMKAFIEKRDPIYTGE